MSFYGGNQNGAQPGSAQQQQIGRQQPNPGLQNVQQVLTPQLFNINVNPNQLHNFFNEHNSSQNQLQLNAAAGNPSILLQTQQPQSFPVNIINDQLGVGVGQLITPASVPQGQMQGLPISMASGLNFPPTIHQVHAQTAASQQNQAQNQQSKQQRVFTGTVTKIHDNFGFIDEEVFFQMGVVKGPILPKEGDRVLVEADFNASMPFKWNATRVQIVNIGGGMNNLSNLNSNQHSQPQHSMAFNTSVGMQKQSAPPPPVHTSQNVARHGGQPVTIVSNPHSVYSGSNNPRARTAIGAPGTGQPPVAPLVPGQREPPKRPMPQMNMPAAPDPPAFISNPVAGMISDRERSREAARERSRERSRERMTMRERSRERARARSRERSRERVRNNRSREREKLTRPRSRSRDRPAARERSRDRSIRGTSRDRSRERIVRERSVDRAPPSRVRSRSRDRNPPERSADRRERNKRDASPEKSKDRARAKDRDHRKKSPSPPTKSTKDDNPKRDSKNTREKDKQTADKGKTPRDRNSPITHPQSSERSKRSKSRESVRTERGHVTEKSRSRSASPRRKNLARPPPRYAVEIPKYSLDMKDINSKEIQRRYPNLYVPSDFFLAKSTWMDTFPLNSPFELGHPCPVQIMRKGVQKIEIPNPDGLADRFKDIPDVLEPSDASFIFKAKIMIPSMNTLEAIFKKASGVGEGSGEGPDTPQHVDRLINFIVGMKTSKHEVMALGGPWSPSLDGSNPHSDPQTLINTAIRCARALAGINLSRCKHWYRFMELYYKRSNCLETVVFFLPDVWSCLPEAKEWTKLKSLYKYAVYGETSDLMGKDSGGADAGSEDRLSQTVSAAATPSANCDGISKDSAGTQSASTEFVSNSDSTKSTEINGEGESGVQASTTLTTTETSTRQEEEEDDDDSMNTSGLLVIDEAASPSREEGASEDHRANLTSMTEAMDSQDDQGLAAAAVDGVPMEDSLTSGDAPGCGLSTENDSSIAGNDTKVDAVIEEKCHVNEANVATTNTNGKLDISELPPPKAVNPKALNVVQLREQLNLRNLSTKGLKAQLVSRLTEALAKENEESKESKPAELIEDNNGSQPGEVTKEGINTTETEPSTANAEIVTDQVKKEIDKPEVQSLEKNLLLNETKEEVDDEQCIRLVNPSLIFENQDDDDDVSMEDGELKEDPDAKACQQLQEFNQIFSMFPQDTFPIIKPGMKEEEIKMWERRYALPKNSKLLMYPSSTAKGGNFDCISMSLGLLRDYRIIDKKEDSFEVSLFSEFFHEMLQRDFAFRIYREMALECVKTNTDEVLTTEKESEKDEKSDKEKDAAEPATKRRKLSTTSTVTTTAGKKTSDPYLLLSFIFFDVTRCGYITETDLEDLCCCIGIGLTRAQVRKVVSKVVHKGTLYYRKWTEKLEKSKAKPDDNEIRILAQGNMAHFPVFMLQDETNSNALTAVSASSGSEENVEENVIAVVDGRNIDVKKLISQVEKFEKDLAVAESSLNVMKNSLNEAKSQVTDLKKSNEHQKDELTKVKEALKKSESSDKSSKENLDLFKRSTERFIDRIKDFVKLPSPVKEKSETTANNKDSGKEKAKEKPGTESKEKSKSSQESTVSSKEKESSNTVASST